MAKDWIEIEYRYVVEVISGKSQKEVESPNGSYPIYGSGGSIGLSTEYKCEPGTTIIGRKGTINTPIFVNEKFWNIDTAFGLYPTSIVLPLFNYFFCQHFNFKKLDKSTAVPSLAKRDIQAIQFPLPPLPEQRAIVAKIEELFSSLDNGIANLEKAQEQLKVYRQAVLKMAFEGELTKEWREKQTDLPSAEQLLEQIKESVRKGIESKKVKKGEYFPTYDPKDLTYSTPNAWLQLPWKSVVAKHKYAMKRGPFGSALKKSFFVEMGVVVYEQGHAINDDPFRHRYYVTKEKSEELKAFFAGPGDLIISCSGATLGRVSLLPQNADKGIINQALLKITLDKTIILNSYFLHLFRSETFQRMIFKKSLGSAMPNMVGMSELKEIAIPVPVIIEQHQIVQEIESRLSVCDKVEESIIEGLQKAKALKQSILKKAFDGALLSEVELKACRQEADWEPAEVLLERIKLEKEKK